MKTEFNETLKEGQVLEEAVVRKLRELLPDYDVVHTVQDNEIDRYRYSLIDVVVSFGDHILFGIECKIGFEKYLSCQVQNGWDGDYNTPINDSSLKKYKEAQFPVYLLNINTWCHRAFWADLKTILFSPNDAGKNHKKSGVIIYNVDSRGWKGYEGSFTLTTILKDIMKKEGLC